MSVYVYMPLCLYLFISMNTEYLYIAYLGICQRNGYTHIPVNAHIHAHIPGRIIYNYKHTYKNMHTHIHTQA